MLWVRAPTPGRELRIATRAESQEGLAAELNMVPALLSCIKPNEPWVEYGIVETRYARRDPQAFDTLRDTFGHRILGPVRNPCFTASAYIAKLLGDLRDRGELAFHYDKATGDWSYNGSISYWAKPPPGPPKSSILSFH